MDVVINAENEMSRDDIQQDMTACNNIHVRMKLHVQCSSYPLAEHTTYIYTCVLYSLVSMTITTTFSISLTIKNSSCSFHCMHVAT